MSPQQLRDTVRANVKARRGSLGMTQSGLAQATGVKQPTIAQIEAGTITPTLETLSNLAEALDVSPDLLLRPGIFSEIRA